MAKENSEASINIYGVIGNDIDGNIVAQQISELDERIDTINLLINSDGGSVSQGLSIVSAILSAKAYIHVFVNGIAASMAAVIAVAGDKVTMQDYAKMMIHDPFFSGQGNDKLSAKDKKALDSITDTLQTLLSRRGCSKEKIAALMKDETWFTAEEAKLAGLADEVMTTKRKEELSNLSVPELMNRIMNEYQTNTKSTNSMKEIAKALGLPEDATEEQILATLKERQKLNNERENKLIAHYMSLGEKSGIVNEKNKDRMQRLAVADFDLFVDMLKVENSAEADDETVVDKKDDSKRLSDVISKVSTATGKAKDEHDWDWYQKHNPKALIEMEKSEPEKFKRLLDEYEHKIEG